MADKHELIDPCPLYLDYDEQIQYCNKNTLLLFDTLIEYEDNATEKDAKYFERELILARYTYVRQGQILYHIFSQHLYKESGYSSFLAYSKDILGFKWYQVKNLVECSRIAQFLLKEGFKVLPNSQSQCKVLMLLENELIEDSLNQTPYDRIKTIWDKVVSSYSQEKITTKVIKATIKDIYPNYIPDKKFNDIQVEIEVSDKLQSLARDYEMGINETLEHIVNQYHDENNLLSETSRSIDDENFSYEDEKISTVKSLCERLSVDFDDLLETLSKENTLIGLISKGYLSVKKKFTTINENIGLTINQLANRLDTTVSKIEDNIQTMFKEELQLWIQKRDPEGIAFEYIDGYFIPMG